MNNAFTTPVIMSTPMIRALLDGRKTQTRRLVTSQWANLKMHFDMGEQCFVWVRESFSERRKPEKATDGLGRAWYKTDSDWSGEIKWRPSIHMPRWASRLTLEVTNVRLQRLQDISEADAVAEGIQEVGLRMLCVNIPVFHWRETATVGEGFDLAWVAYSDLWELLHGEGSWEENPEVVAISFRIHRQNIDALLADRRSV